MIQISINGEAKTFPAALNVTELVVALDLLDKRIAIERNGEIIAKSQYTATMLADGDVLEMVVAVGGG
ncbi:sulfur carrier protein ThiS [Deefgea sp. CFH1-16]|uniref:sulfur carrier protein ThiS n=1 Tax=Deefgea sp. CFH1-16 TaxID=2675457 RepID=UPI0015F63B6E|nr:sulfur carrier protein ThiS [Deefgea sp. CFH1-16]MBM5574823.1 sulfur carrier protein ThiS [Deefgea sp. CFH1-16]